MASNQLYTSTNPVASNHISCLRSAELFSISKLIGCQSQIIGLLKTELESDHQPQPSLLQQLPEKYLLKPLYQELLPLLQQQVVA